MSALDVQSGTLEVVSKDARREIKEFEFSDSAFNDFTIRGDAEPVGQHYHREKTEVFYFIEGGGVLYSAMVNDEGTITGEVEELEIKPGTVVKIPPYRTHRFDLKPGTRFVAHSSRPFDPDDMPSCPIEID